MTNIKPNCPTCVDSAFVKTLGGGSKGKYRYKCLKCDAPPFQKEPLIKNASAEELERMLLRDKDLLLRDWSGSKAARKQPKYGCRKCGAAVKRGHTCSSLANDPKRTKAAAETPPNMTIQLPNNERVILPLPTVQGSLSQIQVSNAEIFEDVPLGDFLDSLGANCNTNPTEASTSSTGNNQPPPLFAPHVYLSTTQELPPLVARQQ